MAKNSPGGPLLNLLLIIIAGLIAVFYALFLPETPTSSAPISSQHSAQIPLGSSAIGAPGQIQGTTSTGLTLQKAAQISPSQLNNVSP